MQLQGERLIWGQVSEHITELRARRRMSGQPGWTARMRKPIGSIMVVQEFTTESIAELANLNPSHMETGLAQDPGQLNAFHEKLPEDARASITGLPNRPVLAPLLNRNANFDNLSRYSGGVDYFDPFSVLPHAKKWVPTQQQPLITYCRHIQSHTQI